MKVYERTENGTTTAVSVRDALAEINTAMLEGRRDVRTMSSGRGRHDITYKDGRHILLVEVDAPEATDRFATNCIPVSGGKVHTATPDSADGEAFPLCRTGGQNHMRTTYAVTTLDLTCRTCLGYAEGRAAQAAR